MRRYIAIFLSCIFALPVKASSPKGQKLKIAILYPQDTGEDIKCAIDAGAIYEKVTGIDVQRTFIPYSSRVSDLKSKAQEIVQKKYDVVIGPLLSHESQITAEIFKNSHVTQILPIATDPSLAVKYPKIIQVLPSALDYSKQAAHFAVLNSNSKEVLIVSNSSLPYSYTYAEEFKKNLKILGFKGKITEHKFYSGTKLFDKSNSALQKSNPTFIYAPVYAKDLVQLYSYLNQRPIKATIFTHAGMYDAKNGIQPILSNDIPIVFNGIWDQTASDATSKNFLRAIKSQCDISQIKPWSFAAWEGYRLAVEGFKELQKSPKYDLKTSIAALQYSGILGKWQLNSTNTPIRNLSVYRLNKNGIRLVKVIKPLTHQSGGAQ